MSVLQGVGHLGNDARYGVEIVAARTERGRSQSSRGGQSRGTLHIWTGHFEIGERGCATAPRTRGVRRTPGTIATRLAGHRCNSACPHLLNDVIDRRPVDQFHGVEVDAVLFAGGVDRHDVAVVQAGGGLGLAVEALHRGGGQARPRGQDLQRHPAVERGLPRLVDDAHAAAPQLANDLEVTEPSARRGSFTHG